MGELVPLIEQMAAETPALAGVLTAALALAHAEADRTEDARHLLEEFAAADFDLPLDQAWITGMVCYAEAAIECRDPKYAGPLFDRLAPWADQSVAVRQRHGVRPGQPLPRWTCHRPRPLRRGRRLLRPIRGVERPVGAKFFAARNGPPVGKDARRTPCPG